MSIIATFQVPPEDFPLGPVLQSLGEVEVQMERIVPLRGRVIPFVWVSGDDAEEADIEQALEEHEEVEDVSVLDHIGNDWLVRLEWQPELGGLLEAILDSEGVLLDASGSNDEGRFSVQFDDHTGVSEFHQHCQDNGIEATLLRLHTPEERPAAWADFGLTESQYIALVTAHEAGFFDVPRGTTLTQLADEFGISDSAISQRIRRGIDALIENTLLVPDQDQD
ncbi:helix-turn-helix domain-containing protein [Haloarchaeobius sp. HME9146]|uniref:helix-turn-helix domain-containing protein n=1 Tax=Haloarchaeobius sp. HME9146 TaxID=2978732 RepID=UPI0021C0E6A2|nr:helix-turn-helix domain-containing protein [Haloarchaeobius sp. HME9146]MCT9097101.1 helix-turn-helix domain-containing protein [Haloarchaeobius sp. HME9146]